MRNIWIALSVILVAGGILWLVATPKKRNPIGKVHPTPQETQSPVSSPSASLAQVKELNIKGSEFAFEPASITLTQGEKVKVTFDNIGKFPHNLVISDLNVATKTIQPNETDTIEFTTDKSGTFNMVCTVDAHEQKGMKGTLIIQ